MIFETVFPAGEYGVQLEERRTGTAAMFTLHSSSFRARLLEAAAKEAYSADYRVEAEAALAGDGHAH